MAQKPTLKTISELSGLAVPTVSRALNDAPDISIKTKKKIREIAEEVGYFPDRAGLRLRTGRTNVISLVLATDHDVMNQTSRMISSIATGLRGTSYHLNMTPYFRDQNVLDPLRYIVETGAADALIINQIKPDDERVAYLQSKEFPFVAHGRSEQSPNYSYYDYDNRAFGEFAVNGLIKSGARHLLMIAPPREQFYGSEMILGAQNAARDAGVQLDIPDQVSSDVHNLEVREFVLSYLQKQPQTDGLIAGSLGAAMACLAACQASGRVIGDDIEIFTKEVMTFFQNLCPEVQTVREDIEKAGNFLAKSAMHAIKNPKDAPLQELEYPNFDT